MSEGDVYDDQIKDPREISALSRMNDWVMNHDATQMELNLNSLWSSHYTLVRNYQEFENVVNEFNVTKEEKWDNYREGERDRFKIPRDYTPEEASKKPFLSGSPSAEDEMFVFLRECNRALTNYATSANSLYQHAQNFKSEWVDGEVEKQYAEKLDELELYKKGSLVRDFRQYISHKKSIPLAVSEHRGPEPGSRDIDLTITRGKLTDWGRLSADSKQYLDDMDTIGINKEKIDVPWVIGQHKEAINEFYNWLTEAMYDSYSDEFKHKEMLEREYEKMRTN